MRQKPITRDEVRISGYSILTMPERGVAGHRAVDRLWQPLVRELGAERDAYLASDEWQGQRIVPWTGMPRRLPEPPHVPLPHERPSECRVCRKTFFQAHGRYSKPRASFCTDACIAQWRRVKRADQRRQDSARRAAARADRVCAVCGEAIEAARSTRRYCSTKCRVAAHRATPHGSLRGDHSRGSSMKALGKGTCDDRCTSTDHTAETAAWWYIASIRNNKTTGRKWLGLMTSRPTRRKTLPVGTPLDDPRVNLIEIDERGRQRAVIETVYYVKFRTRAEAQRRCDQLKAEETDPRYEYMPLSRWKFDAQSKTCGIRPWTTREEDLASIEFSRRLHDGEFDACFVQPSRGQD